MQNMAFTEAEAKAFRCGRAICYMCFHSGLPCKADAQQLVELQSLAHMPRGFQIIHLGYTCGSNERCNCFQLPVHSCLFWGCRNDGSLFQLWFVTWALTTARRYVCWCRARGISDSVGLALPPRCWALTPEHGLLCSLWWGLPEPLNRSLKASNLALVSA